MFLHEPACGLVNPPCIGIRGTMGGIIGAVVENETQIVDRLSFN